MLFWRFNIRLKYVEFSRFPPLDLWKLERFYTLSLLLVVLVYKYLKHSKTDIIYI